MCIRDSACAVAARLPELVSLILHQGGVPEVRVWTEARSEIVHELYGIFAERAGCNRLRLAVCEETLGLLKQSCSWSQESHHLFGPAFRHAVRCLVPVLATRVAPVSYTHLRAHETPEHLVCRLLLEKKKTQHT
eukprot:TRINITY_DN53841_c0_g1_i1.p3 TRINITY_DN53841_c0_g1~~TRINITY_DN53841_c0_g1_i1.p3  ORF type:complete len:134 (-),score=20.13 TRINITY_DN53841_c0_g1_i1:83-484(-)